MSESSPIVSDPIKTKTITEDDGTGEPEIATILGPFGEVPDDFAESLSAA